MRKSKYLIYLLVGIIAILFGIGVYMVVHNKNVDHSIHKGKVKYHCPMHPTYISDKPGDCPICGMKLVPIEKREEQKQEGYESNLKDRAPVTISEEQEQIIGVKIATVKRQDLALTVRAAGRIAHDPELYSTIVEYKRAIFTYEESKAKNVSPEIIKQTEDLVESTKLKLLHMGLSHKQIKEMVARADPTNLLFVDKPGKTVWVYAQIYEQEIGLVKEGQKIEVTSISLPGKKFIGVISSIDTYLDSETRTLKVRAEVDNPDGLLKPEMYVDTIIYVNLGKKLAIPVDSVIDTGTRKIVFVQVAKGKYMPKEIITGYEANGFYEVISGLKEGDLVVSSANFLIDSESKLKFAISGMVEHKH